MSSLLLRLTSVVLYVVAWTHVRRRHTTRWPLLSITTWLIVASGTLTLLSGPVTIFQASLNARDRVMPVAPGLSEVVQLGRDAAATSHAPDQADPQTEPARDPPVASTTDDIEQTSQDSQNVGTPEPPKVSSYVGGWGVFNILVTHVFACAFLPWTARESMRPIMPLLVINAAVTLTMLTYLRSIGGAPSGEWIFAGVMILFSPLVASPGMSLCWWRHSRFREEATSKLVRGRYAEMRRELTDARRIHESLFPKMLLDGPITFAYVYEPMRQIGGDYLYVQKLAGDATGLHMVIMDVTGHGIPAALTVNRLHGELQRIFAEQPGVMPGEVLRLLNRYVNLTMADHALFVTAICLRVDPTSQVVDYASGGHPPAYLRTADGFVHELPATTYLLGAEMDSAFDPGQSQVPFKPGDRIAAFTDGAIEARTASGKMIGLAGMRAIVARIETRGERHWAARLLQEIDQTRSGPPTDDTLVVEIGFSLASSPAPAAIRPQSIPSRV
jgi:serine phosphatase RsbU (regulator of sigma subunit)